MKSNLAFFLLASLLLASCSQDDVVQEIDTSQSAIGFRTFVDKASRAYSTELANFQTFKVWATKFREGNTVPFRLMDAVDVSKNGDVWTYSPTKYWVNDNAYSFTAIGSSYAGINNCYSYIPPAVANINYETYLTHDVGQLFYNNGIESFTFNKESDNAFTLNGANAGADIVWASSKVNPIPEGEQGPAFVNLTFGHLLSRVKLKFVDQRTAVNDSYVILKNVKVTSAAAGELDFSGYSVGTPVPDFKWTPYDDTFNCQFEFDPAEADSKQYTLYDGSNMFVETQDQFLIPNQDKITVYFDCYTPITQTNEAEGHITIVKDIFFGDNGSPSPFKNLQLKPGYSYTLIAYLTDDLDNSGEISFKVSVDDFIDASPAYAISFANEPILYTYKTNENDDVSDALIRVSKITSVNDLVYYGPLSADMPETEQINYADYTYTWSIPENPNFTLANSSKLDGTNNLYKYTINGTAGLSASDLNVRIYCRGNYSPNGKPDEENTGTIVATLTVSKDGKTVITGSVVIPIKYFLKSQTSTGGSLDGDDNDG